MARGNEAKEKLIQNFIKSNSENYIGCFDKKYYFWSTENGEKVQVCVALTCPKTPIDGTETVAAAPNVSDVFDWSGAAPVQTTVATEISEEEQENLKVLMEKLGL